MKEKLRRRYLKIDDRVFLSEAFRTLPSGALKLWLDMRTQFKGSNNGNISATMSILAHRGWTSTHTLHRVLPVLLERGLIARTRQGKPGPYRICSLYRFTDLPTAKNEAAFIVGSPATYDFEHWIPPTTRKSRASETEATLLPKRERNKFRNGSVEAITDSETEARKKDEIGLKPKLHAGFDQNRARRNQRFRNGTPLYLPGDTAVAGGIGHVVDRALDVDPVVPERAENPADEPQPPVKLAGNVVFLNGKVYDVIAAQGRATIRTACELLPEVPEKSVESAIHRMTARGSLTLQRSGKTILYSAKPGAHPSDKRGRPRKQITA